jgi:hypothetical protein
MSTQEVMPSQGLPLLVVLVREGIGPWKASTCIVGIPWASDRSLPLSARQFRSRSGIDYS